MLRATDFDHHLLEARHDGCRPKVPKVGHPVPRTETEHAVGAILFALQHVAATGRVRALRHGRYVLLQWWSRELGVNWLLGFSRWRRIAFLACWFPGVFRVVGGRVVVTVAGAFVFVVHAC